MDYIIMNTMLATAIMTVGLLVYLSLSFSLRQINLVFIIVLVLCL